MSFFRKTGPECVPHSKGSCRNHACFRMFARDIIWRVEPRGIVVPAQIFTWTYYFDKRSSNPYVTDHFREIKLVTSRCGLWLYPIECVCGDFRRYCASVDLFLGLDFEALSSVNSRALSMWVKCSLRNVFRWQVYMTFACLTGDKITRCSRCCFCILNWYLSKLFNWRIYVTIFMMCHRVCLFS